MATWLFEADFGSGWEDITAYVKLNTMQRRMEIHKELRPTTNTMTFNIAGDATLIGKLMVGDADVPVQVHKDEADYFAGYLQRTTEASVSTGLDDVRITVYDPGIKLQRKVTTDYSAASIAVSDAVAAILTAGGITDQSLTAIATTIDGLVLVAGEDTYWDAIDKLLSEFGYVLYFDEAGTAKTYFLYPAYPTSSKTYTTGASGNVDDKLTVAKKKKRYGGCKVTYYRHITKTDAIVFSDTTNAGQLNKCNIDLTGYANGYPDRDASGTVVYAEYTHEEGEVIATADVEDDIDGTGSVTVATFTDKGKRAEVKITGSGIVTRFDIIAGTAILKGPAVIKEALITGVSEPSEEIECRYLTADADAAVLVSGRKKYWEKSGITWGFKTTDDVTLGSIITISDSNLSVNQVCLLVGYDEDDEAKRTVWCEAIEDYALATITTTGAVSSTNTTGSEAMIAADTAQATADAAAKTWIQATAPTIGTRPNAINGDSWRDSDDNTLYQAVGGSWRRVNKTTRYIGMATEDPSTDIQEGDYYLKTDATPKVFRRYSYDDGWEDVLITDPLFGNHVGSAIQDLVSLDLDGDDESTGGFTLIVNLVAKNLFAKAIQVLTGGSIRGGDRYDSTGAVLDEAETGFWMGANGQCKLGGSGAEYSVDDGDFIAYSGEGDDRRYVEVAQNAVRWGNYPVDGTKEETHSIERLSNATSPVILSGFFNAEIDSTMPGSQTQISTFTAGTSGKWWVKSSTDIVNTYLNGSSKVAKKTYNGSWSGETELSAAITLDPVPTGNTKFSACELAALHGYDQAPTGANYILKMYVFSGTRTWTLKGGNAASKLYYTASGFLVDGTLGSWAFYAWNGDLFCTKILDQDSAGTEYEVDGSAYASEIQATWASSTKILIAYRVSGVIYERDFYPGDGTFSDRRTLVASGATVLNGYSDPTSTTRMLMYQTSGGKYYLEESATGYTSPKLFTTGTTTVTTPVQAIAGTDNGITLYYIGTSNYLYSLPLSKYGQLGMGIVDSGSTTTGSYIKFSDGTLEQWGTTNNTTALSNADGVWYVAGLVITMPAQFLASPPPIMIANCAVGSGSSYAFSCAFVATGSPTGTTFTGTIQTNYNYGTTVRSIYWHAIGRWK